MLCADVQVLETIRELGSVEYTQSRLQRLTAKELLNVKNVPAYLYTLLRCVCMQRVCREFVSRGLKAGNQMFF